MLINEFFACHYCLLHAFKLTGSMQPLFVPRSATFCPLSFLFSPTRFLQWVSKWVTDWVRAPRKETECFVDQCVVLQISLHLSLSSWFARLGGRSIPKRCLDLWPFFLCACQKDNCFTVDHPWVLLYWINKIPTHPHKRRMIFLTWSVLNASKHTSQSRS